MKIKKMLSMQIVEWRKRSECGEVCGILGCESIPIVSCPRCGNWYCDEHSLIHFHPIKENPKMRCKIIIIHDSKNVI